MAVRKRFSRQERELLASGLAIDVQNVTQWHRARRAPGAVIERDGRGWETLVVTIAATRGTVHVGDAWAATPGHVRMRPVAGSEACAEAAPHGPHPWQMSGDNWQCQGASYAAEVPAWHGVPRPAMPGRSLDEVLELLTREARAGFAALGMDPDTAMRGY